MLAPRQIIFTAVDGILDDAGRPAWEEALNALQVLARHGIPLVLATRGTRAQIEPLRRKLEHAHPFLTESGGGLFIPDGYFNLRLEGAIRTGRNFCVPFARSHAETAAALAEIAEEAGASVIGFGQMSVREITRNSGLSPQEAERFQQREFGEIFFFAGETGKTAQRFSKVARERGWKAVPGEPLWKLRARLKQHGQSAVGYLMGMYRKAVHGRLQCVGIGNDARDLYFLSETDKAVVLALPGGNYDALLASRLPRGTRSKRAGAAGWAEAIRQTVEGP